MARATRATNRRRFLQFAAAAAATGPAAVQALAPNEKVHLAAVGVGGKGWSDIQSTSQGHHVIAFCDVETGKARRGRGGFGAAAEAWPRARRYTDWREMLDKEHQHLDGLTVSTPDHMHAPITMTAIQLGLATYTQKPLSRTVLEARRLAEAAAKAKVVTQMGNQGHSGVGYRTLVKLLHGGAIGRVKQAHAWSNRPIWPQGIQRPDGASPVPSTLKWDLWLGVADERPFVAGAYHPFNWRGWFDFGAGALGDMGCHILDPVVWGLELGPPERVRYEGPAPQPETFPSSEIITYQFAATPRTLGDPVEVKWYDGGKLPPAELAWLPEGERLPANGTLFIGEKGNLLTAHGGFPQLLPAERFSDYEMPQLEPQDHYLQWTQAIRGADRTTSDFAYAGPLTETVLLGTIACRRPGVTLQWDSNRLRFTNDDAANELVHVEYRKGWKVDGLS